MPTTTINLRPTAIPCTGEDTTLNTYDTDTNITSQLTDPYVDDSTSPIHSNSDWGLRLLPRDSSLLTVFYQNIKYHPEVSYTSLTPGF